MLILNAFGIYHLIFIAYLIKFCTYKNGNSMKLLRDYGFTVIKYGSKPSPF